MKQASSGTLVAIPTTAGDPPPPRSGEPSRVPLKYYLSQDCVTFCGVLGPLGTL